MAKLTYKGINREALVAVATEMNKVLGFEKDGNPIDVELTNAKLYKELMEAGAIDPEDPANTGLALTDDFTEASWAVLEKMGLKPVAEEEPEEVKEADKTTKAKAAKDKKATTAKAKKDAAVKAAADAKATPAKKKAAKKKSRLVILSDILNDAEERSREGIIEEMLKRYPGEGLASSTAFETNGYLRSILTCGFMEEGDDGIIRRTA